MDLEASGKRPVRLTIFNQSFSLLVAGDPAELEKAAQEVDELMSTIARSANMDSTRVAILACLHLQDRVRSLEREFVQLKSHVEDTSREFSMMLDQVISPPASAAPFDIRPELADDMRSSLPSNPEPAE